MVLARCSDTQPPHDHNTATTPFAARYSSSTEISASRCLEAHSRTACWMARSEGSIAAAAQKKRAIDAGDEPPPLEADPAA